MDKLVDLGIEREPHCCPCGSRPCFPSVARVSLESGRSISMAELQVGDRVQAGNCNFNVDLYTSNYLKQEVKDLWHIYLSIYLSIYQLCTGVDPLPIRSLPYRASLLIMDPVMNPSMDPVRSPLMDPVMSPISIRSRSAPENQQISNFR